MSRLIVEDVTQKQVRSEHNVNDGRKIVIFRWDFPFVPRFKEKYYIYMNASVCVCVCVGKCLAVPQVMKMVWNKRIPLSHWFLDAFATFRKTTINFVMAVRPYAWKNSAPTGQIFMKFDIWVFFSKICQGNLGFTNTWQEKGTLHEHVCTFMTVSRSILLRMRNVSSKMCGEKTYILFSETFPRRSCYLRDNVETYATNGGLPEYNTGAY